MKTLIVVYSRSGNNKKLSKELQQIINCDLDEIVDNTNREGLLGLIKSGKQAMSKKETKIEPPKKNPADYETIIISSPVWAGTLPPAARTYLSTNKDRIKKIALFSVSGQGGKNVKVVPEIEELLGQKVFAKLMLDEKEFKNEDYQEKLDSFAKNLL